MRGKVTINTKSKYIHFQFDQGATIQDWKEAQETLLQLSKKTGLARVLVDVRKQKADEHMAKLFEFGVNIPSAMAFAVLSERHREDHRFVETVALNRGRNVSLFFGPEEEAIAWLMNWSDKT